MLDKNFWSRIWIYIPKGIDEISCLKFSFFDRDTKICAIFLQVNVKTTRKILQILWPSQKSWSLNCSLYLCLKVWIHRCLKFLKQYIILNWGNLQKKKVQTNIQKNSVSLIYVENAKKLSGSNKGKSKNREKKSSDSCGQPTFREGPLLCEVPLRCGAIQVSSGVENGRWVL